MKKFCGNCGNPVNENDNLSRLSRRKQEANDFLNLLHQQNRNNFEFD